MNKNSRLTGLTDAQVAQSRLQNGVNVLTPAPQTPLWKRFIGKFADPLIVILLVAGVLSIAISFYEYYGLEESAEVFFEPVGIFMAIFLATGLAFFFEVKADREFAILNKVNDDEPVQALRNGSTVVIPRRDVVVGDTIYVNTGEEVPADGTLLDAVTLSVDESTLTGEPMCRKTTDPARFNPNATFASNRLLRGTKIMEGHGIMKVEAVGDKTENGKVFTATQIDQSVKTPLNEQLDRLGVLISRVAYACAAIIIVCRMVMFLVNMPFEWVPFLAYMLQSVMIAVTLICVSVPEGLPMAVTLSLAYSMRRMLKNNNLVRKLHACETMGATTVICTDKTGTLTQNRMQVAEIDLYGNPPADIIYDGMALNSTAKLDCSEETPKVIGNPTEGALLLWLRAQGADEEQIRSSASRVAELPFSTERKYMATVARLADGRKVLFVKGAPEIVFALCRNTPGTTAEQIGRQLSQLQNRAMRTLAFAYQILDSDNDRTIEDSKVVADNLTFAGIAAISDPVRSDVPEAIREVQGAGIEVKIVTGDTPATAKEIGRQIGLWNDATDNESNIITGPEFDSLSDEELTQRVEKLKIIARARPLDKKRLVEALQRCGEVVAVTGDGTNDAPALKAAHVGLSMGDGTAVAKEASDITIIDNSFASIGKAVMWGRSLYRNIQRFILFQMTVNVVASLIVLFGSMLGMQSPLTVTQMLWVNLIMDTFAALALASLPPTPSVMKDKPRLRTASIINPAMWRRIIGEGLVMFALLFALLVYLEHTHLNSLTEIGRVAFGPNTGLPPYELSLFFTIFVFMQFWNLFNARAFETGRSALHFKDCSGFLLVVGMIFCGQIAIIEFGGAFFSVTPLKLTDWLIIIFGTSAVLWAGEAYRAVANRR